jgi:hypothetical protein
MKINIAVSFFAEPAHGYGALPLNKGMQLTVKSVTPFAKRRAKVTPLFRAAHPRR